SPRGNRCPIGLLTVRQAVANCQSDPTPRAWRTLGCTDRRSVRRTHPTGIARLSPSMSAVRSYTDAREVETSDRFGDRFSEALCSHVRMHVGIHIVCRVTPESVRHLMAQDAQIEVVDSLS